MKNLFPGYYRPTDDEFDTLWNECIFVFDTNVLLDLYRYESKTSKRLIEILERYQERIWIPNRVALEYLDNRLGVISKQADAYSQVIQKAGQLKTQLQKELQIYQKHAFIDVDKLFDNVWKELDASIAQLNDLKKAHPKLLDHDPIWEKITELFNERVGDSLTEERLLQLQKEGERRYSAGIPPGYKDDTKKSSKQFGDYIIWYEIKELAKREQKPIIFVTDDGKEDWWYEHKGKTIGPRPELINEIRRESKQLFYIYQTKPFLKYAQDKLNIPNDESIIKNIDAIQELNQSIDLRQQNSYLLHDFDNDQIHEVVTVSKHEDRLIDVYKPHTITMNGMFMPVESIYTTGRPEYLSLFDIDGDGSLEIVCTLGWDTAIAYIFFKYINGEFGILYGHDEHDETNVSQFVNANLYDYDGDGLVEIVSEPWDVVPVDLIPEGYIKENPLHPEPWGRVRYVWKWDKSINLFRLIERKLNYIGGR